MRPARSRKRLELLEKRELIWRRHDRWHFVDGSGGPIHPAVIRRLSDSSRVAMDAAATGRAALRVRRASVSANEWLISHRAGATAKQRGTDFAIGPIPRNIGQ